MDLLNSALLTTTEELLRYAQTDSTKFQSFYDDTLQNREIPEEEIIAQKIGSLTQSQLYLLQSQVLAYKHLIRNIPVPTNLSWNGLHSNTWQTEKDKLTTKTVTYYRDKVEKEHELKAMITGNIKTEFKNDPKESAKIVANIVQRRINQIDQLIAEKGEKLTQEARTKLVIEKRFLGLRDLYKHVIGDIVGRLKDDKKSVLLFEHKLLERGYFKREKLAKNREGVGRVERLQNQMKSDHERRKKIKHKQFMQHLRVHKEELLEWHRRKQKDRKKIANQAKAIYDTKKKEKEVIQDKKTQERLKALKQQDMIKYFELVKEAKNNKINELLGQTNKFLKELGAKVLIQKGSSQDDTIQAEPAEAAEEDLQNNFNSSNNVYYNLTHTVKEEIKQQPTILEGGELKNYQLIGLQWLVSLYNNNLNGILADQMGLGKTIQTISLLSYLIEFKKNYGPFLIVVPLSTISNWVSEFEKWAPSIRKIIYRGNPMARAEIQRAMKANKWNVCLTTYDFILKDRQKLNKYDWKYIVIDEGHKMKNAKSKFAGVLGQQYHSTHRLLLTGTPLQNNLTELWALLNFLLPKVFNSCDDFQKWFSMAIAKRTGEKETVQLNEEEQLLIINRLHQVLRPFLLRRVKKQVESELPDKKEYVVKVELSAWQKLIYDNISNKTAMEFEGSGGKISTTTLTNLMMQLRKCCNHPYMFLRNYDQICFHDWIFRCSGKFELLDRILPKLKISGHRVLIFTQMTHLMDIMQIYFEYKSIKHLRLDGSTKAEDRGQRTTMFNEANSQYDVFLLSTRAGGLGLNLQSADTVILFDSDWNPQMDLQAQDRAHRIGQKKQVVVLRFITNTPIQEAILEKAAFKMNLDELLIQGGLYNLNSSDAERKQKIEDLLKRRNCNEENEDEEIPDDEMINKFIARSEEQYETYTRMDEERYQEQRLMYKNFEEISGDGQHKRINCRLMSEEEIPSWFVEAPKSATAKNKEYGRGNRVRKQVNYFDNEEALDLSPEDDNSSLVVVPKKKGKRKMENKEKDASEEPEEIGDDIE